MVKQTWRNLVGAARLFALAWRDFAVLLAFLVTLLVLWWPASVRLLSRMRADTDQERSLVLRYTGVEINSPGPEPAVRGGWTDAAVSLASSLRTPAVRRNLWWHLANPLVGGGISVLPWAAVGGMIWGLLQPVFFPLWRNTIDHPWSMGFPVSNEATAIIGAVWAVVVTALLVWRRSWYLHLYARWAAGMLHDDGALRQRVDQLTRTRRTAVQLQADELRRIERDLHDGPQAALVALGMTLSATESLLRRNSQDADAALSVNESARTLLLQSRQRTTEVLDSIRRLSRGIAPPVLSDRGLAAAIEAAATDSPIAAGVRAELQAEPPAVLASAMYFAVNEALANAAKHSGAAQVVIELADTDGVLTAHVTDDGRGGARVEPGGGIDGLRRRLEVFDGQVRLDSVPGEGTRVTLAIPLTD